MSTPRPVLAEARRFCSHLTSGIFTESLTAASVNQQEHECILCRCSVDDKVGRCDIVGEPQTGKRWLNPVSFKVNKITHLAIFLSSGSRLNYCTWVITSRTVVRNWWYIKTHNFQLSLSCDPHLLHRTLIFFHTRPFSICKEILTIILSIKNACVRAHKYFLFFLSFLKKNK